MRASLSGKSGHSVANMMWKTRLSTTEAKSSSTESRSKHNSQASITGSHPPSKTEGMIDANQSVNQTRFDGALLANCHADTNAKTTRRTKLMATDASMAPTVTRDKRAARTVSETTLVPDDGFNSQPSTSNLPEHGIEALDSDSQLDSPATSGMADKNDRDTKLVAVSANGRARSRLELVSITAGVVDRTTNALGKRGREVVATGLGKLQGLAMSKSRRTSSRQQAMTMPSHTEATQVSDEPAYKRARLSDNASDTQAGHSTPKPQNKCEQKQKKQWLMHGLYLGQDRGFEAKYSEKKNKLRKKQKSDKSNPEDLASTDVVSNEMVWSGTAAFPMPMFAGQTLLDIGRPFRLPFDVFSPLPPGRSKPDEWKKTHKNVFVGDAAIEWRKSRPLEHSTCLCQPETGCDEDCINRFMLYECDESNCNIGELFCTNRAFAELRQRYKDGSKYNIGVEVMKTPDRGYGVRANRTFEPHQIITEYTGEIITQEDCETRMHTIYKDAACYYLMDFDQGMILDATRGSMARFVNHSCEPNCKMVKWTVAGKPRMALFAGERGIMTAEELTYDYNFDPYSVKNVQECRCGAVNCRKVLGPRPKDKERDIRQALEPLLKLGKRKPGATVVGSILVKAGGKNNTTRLHKRSKLTGSASGISKGHVLEVARGNGKVAAKKCINDVDPEAIMRKQRRRQNCSLAQKPSTRSSSGISGVTLTSCNKSSLRRRSDMGRPCAD